MFSNCWKHISNKEQKLFKKLKIVKKVPNHYLYKLWNPVEYCNYETYLYLLTFTTYPIYIITESVDVITVSLQYQMCSNLETLWVLTASYVNVSSFLDTEFITFTLCLSFFKTICEKRVEGKRLKDAYNIYIFAKSVNTC